MPFARPLVLLLILSCIAIENVWPQMDAALGLVGLRANKPTNSLPSYRTAARPIASFLTHIVPLLNIDDELHFANV